ncbi:MAG TPA: methylmalonyl-CoA mutase family protein [Candidatus Binatus sp.]|nr:methylmalonyl-CoA mutase family protein [Candidatus Binatus sp.]
MARKLDAPPEPSPTTRSGTPIRPLYTRADLGGLDAESSLGAPGRFPFTRGIYESMYRGKLWTMRQYAGMGTARETNERFKYLLRQGQTGLSVALDLPTQLGYDSDAPEAMGEVGRVGVAISSLADMETIFEGIPLGTVSTSFTINATAAILLAMYEAVAERQGVPRERIAGTIQNDILKEFGARGAWVLPVEPSMRLVVDAIAYCTEHLPRFNPISIASHFRDAGATPAEEAAYTLADGVAYVEACLARGLAIDAFAPRLSWFFYTYVNFFEEIAKYRACRRLWARLMRDRFKATNAESQRLRIAVVCGGHSLTKQEPLNNISRLTIETMAVALGGVQSVFTAAYDEAYAIPTEESARTSLRIQQIIAYESDVAQTTDPLAGSYFVEALTDEMEAKITAVMDEIGRRGGMVECLKRGWVQQQISRRAYEWEQRVASGEQKIVGVNCFRSAEEPHDVAVYQLDPRLEADQVDRLKAVRGRRDGSAVEAALAELGRAAQGSENLMGPIRRAVRAYATTGEIMGVLRARFGEYRPPTDF